MIWIAALASVKHLDVGSVLSIQNGVLKNEQLAQTFGWGKVLGAMAAFSGAVLPTGTVRFTANQGFYLGELPAGTSARVQTLGDTLERVGIVTHVTPSIQALEWSKYVAWVCAMATAVLTRLEGYQILQDPQMASITAAMLHEMTQIATARGLTLVDMALLPTKTLSELSVDDTVAALEALRRTTGSADAPPENFRPARSRTGQTPGSRRDPGLCRPAGCGTGYPNANDGCLLQTDRRDQPLSPVNGARCTTAPHSPHRRSWYAR